MDINLVLQQGLLFGAYLSVLMTILLFGLLRVNSEAMLNDYPPDIRAKWGPMSAKAARMRLWFGLPMLALIIGMLAWQVVQVVQGSGGFNFGEVALSLWVSMMLFNLYDLVVIDWFILMVLKPSFVILPGTEGLKGYTDYAFHFYGFLKGTVGITVAAPVLAAIAYAVYAVVA